jgi:hypothetical protein
MTGPIKLLLDPGDCFSIPIADSTFAFGQYVLYHPKAGPLVRIFDLRRLVADIDVNELRSAALAFPPVFVGLNPPLKSGRWKKVGAFPIESTFTFPRFRTSLLLRDENNGDWKIWDGQSYSDLGALTPEFSDLEVKCVYAYGDLERRIQSGRDWIQEKT